MGQIEPRETDEQCAIRECREEAQYRVSELQYFTIVYSKRLDEPKSNIELRCYLGTLHGTPKANPRDKIYGFVYIDRNWENKDIKLPSDKKSYFRFN